MSLQEELEAIKRIPLFAKVDTARLKLLAFASDRLLYSDGQYFFRAGDQCDGAYIILDGEAEVLAGEAEALVAKLGPNDIFGEIGMICNQPRTASVRAHGAVTALKIPTDVFMPMLMEFPEIAIEVTIELAHRLDRTTQQLVELKGASASQ